MCAINGIVDLRGRSTEERVSDDAKVKLMNECTAHRGPDATGIWRDDFATLGNNRLAVIDLSSEANQPMTSASGRYVIVFNGEIYNYRELRAQLKSYPFSTESDTEVILAAFEEWGHAAFGRLRGMFGIALWNTQERELTIARDQSGIKPVYYAREGKRFAFSSELKALLTDMSRPRTINRHALESYVRLRYVPGPYTMIQGIEKLPAGSYLTLKGDEYKITEYFSVALSPLVVEPKTTVEKKLRDLVDSAVTAELVSDRPVGLFLSGGLDSTIVLDAATKAKGKIETFSLRFGVDKSEQAEKFNRDADLAARTAEAYGSHHREVLLTEEDFIQLLPEAIYLLDQPLANATAVAQLYLAREARKHIVVALAGDGGDELFGGYPRYRYGALMDSYQRIPAFARAPFSAVSSSLRKLSVPPGIKRVEQFLFEKYAPLSRAVSKEFISNTPADEFERMYLRSRGESDFTQLLMDADRRSWLVDEALARTDTMTMGASLEARVPLLNTDLVTFASRLPTHTKVGFRDGKKILRDAFKDRLPTHVLQAEKSGFFSPTSKWLRRPQMQKLAAEVLSLGYHAGTDAVLNPSGVQALLRDHIEGRAYAMNILWLLISLRLWAKTYDASL